MNLLSLTAVELGKKIKAHEVTVEEATRAALDADRKSTRLNSSHMSESRMPSSA